MCIRDRSQQEGSDLRSLSQGGPKPAGWSWSDELDEELARGERLPAAERVQVPDAPLETQEAEDALIAHGEALGAQGRGRAPLELPEAEAKPIEQTGTSDGGLVSCARATVR